MKKPLPIAVALHYNGMTTPRVTATGHGALAAQIIAAAREHGVPLHEDYELVELLAQIRTGEEIPEALYLAIAKIIAFVYMLKGKFPRGYTP